MTGDKTTVLTEFGANHKKRAAAQIELPNCFAGRSLEPIESKRHARFCVNRDKVSLIVSFLENTTFGEKKSTDMGGESFRTPFEK